MKRVMAGMVFAWIWASLGGAWALVLTSPVDGQVFHPGDTVTLAAERGPNEAAIHSVDFSGDEGWAQFHFSFGPLFRTTLAIPREFLGSLTLKAVGLMGSGQNITVVESSPVTINVVLPSDVILVSMRPDPDQVFLRKMPPGSDPEEVQFSETDRIAVMGKFSDGVERSLSRSGRGTTYVTSDPKVATVDVEGVVSAVAPGQATITIKNGEKQVQVPVYVRPPKQ